jgi:hypothetical protein
MTRRWPATPRQVYSGVYLTYSGGHVYVQDEDTVDEFDRRDIAIDDPDIKTAAAATARATRYLDEFSHEDATLKVTVQLPSDKVNLIKAGHRIQVKFSHIPEYTSFTWVRIVTLSVGQAHDDEDLYDLAIEAKDPKFVGGTRGGPPSAGDVNNQLPPPAPSPGEAASESGIYLSVAPHLTANSPSDGTKLARFVVSATDSFAGTPIVMNAAPYTETGSFNVDSTAGDGSGLDIRGTIPATFFMSNLTIDTNTLYYVWIHYSDTLGGTAYSDGGTTMAVTVGHTLPTGTSLVVVSGAVATAGNGGTFRLCSFYLDDGGGGPTGTPNPPATGQPSGFETPTGTINGSNTSFSTAFPFFEGTLKVWVNGVDWTENIASVDGAAGTFTLTNAPKTNSDILVFYQGA